MSRNPYGDVSTLIAGGGGRMQALTHMHQSTLIAIVIAFLVVVFVSLFIALIWGLSSLIGMFFLALALVTILLDRAKITYEALIYGSIGIFFILLAMGGVTIAIVDFGSLDMFRNFHQIWH